VLLTLGLTGGAQKDLFALHIRQHSRGPLGDTIHVLTSGERPNRCLFSACEPWRERWLLEDHAYVAVLARGCRLHGRILPADDQHVIGV
jgi:hypothetical protein